MSLAEHWRVCTDRAASIRVQFPALDTFPEKRLTSRLWATTVRVGLQREAHFISRSRADARFPFLGRKSMILTADGLRIYAEEVGHGLTSVLVPQRI